MGKQKINNQTDTLNEYLNKDPSKELFDYINTKPRTNILKGATQYIPIDTSNRDYLTGYEDPYTFQGGIGLNEIRAQRQSNLSKIAKLPGRFTTTFAGELAKIPGVAVGLVAGATGQVADLITGEDNTDFMKTAFDNQWITAVTEAQQYIDEEYLPVYVRKAVQDGDFFDKITSAEFFGQDLASGLGFFASFAVPAGVVSKLGAGSKLAKLLGSIDPKVSNALSKINFSGKNADVLTTTFINTVLEGGTEAHHKMREYRENLQQMWMDGDITYEQYQEGLEQDSKVGAQVFADNAAILLAPNYIMSKTLTAGKAATKTSRGVDRFLDTEGKIVDAVKLGKGAYLKQLGKTFAQNLLFEGAIEEVSQGVSGEMRTNDMLADLYPHLNIEKKSFIETYLDKIKTADGQVELFLGGLLGSLGPSLLNKGVHPDITRMREENKRDNELLQFGKDYQSELSNFYTGDKLFQKDADGKTIMENGRPKINPVALMENLTGLSNELDIDTMYQLAKAEGNVELMKKLQDVSLSKYVNNFAQHGEAGVEILQAYMQQEDFLNQLIDENDNNPKKTKQELYKRINSKLDILVSQNERWDRRSPLVNISNENAKEGDYEMFLQKERSKFLTTYLNDDFYNNRIQELQEERKELIGDNETATGYEETVRDQVKEIDKELNRLEKEIEKNDKFKKEFWSNKRLQKEFDNFVNKAEKIRQQTSEENVAKTNEAIQKVKNAQTIEELEKSIKEITEEIEEDDKSFEKQHEETLIQDALSEISEIPTIEELTKSLDKLKKLDLKYYDATKLVNKIATRIESLTAQKAQFMDYLQEIITRKENESKPLIDKIKQTDKELAKLLLKLEKIQNELKAGQELVQDEKYTGKGSRALNKINKELKEFVEEAEQIKKELQQQIKEVKDRRDSLQNELKQLETELFKTLEYLDERTKLTEVLDFESIEDLLSWLKDNNNFKEHRFELTRLKVHRHIAKQEVDSLTTAVNSLEAQIELLQETIGSIKKPSQKLKDELYELHKELQFKREELNEALEKLDRLDQALQDKTMKAVFNQEIELLEGFLKKKKHRVTPLDNPIIADLIDLKRQLLEERQKELEEARAEDDSTAEGNREERVLNTLNEVKTLLEEGNKEVSFVLPTDIKLSNTKTLSKGSRVIFTNVNDKGLFTFKLDNQSYSLSESTILGEVTKTSKEVTNEIKPFQSEGATQTEEIPQEETNEVEKEWKKKGYSNEAEWRKNDRVDSKVISTNEEGVPFDFIEDGEGLVTWERTPRNKVGEKVNFELNNNVPEDSKWKKALDLLNSKKPQEWTQEEIDYLIDNLPINTILGGQYKAPLETKPSTKDSQEIFGNTSRKLRESIIKEMIASNNVEETLSQIQSEVAYQYGGQLKLAPLENGKIPQNKVQDLYEFKGDINNVDAKNIFVANDTGTLVNKDGDILNTMGVIQPGSVYIKIKTANGTAFPLKLNIRTLNETELDFLWDLMIARMQYYSDNVTKDSLQEEKDNAKSTKIKLKDLSPELHTQFVEQFPEEVKLFESLNIKIEELTIQDVNNFFMYNGDSKSNYYLGISEFGFNGGKIRFANGKTTKGVTFDFNMSSERMEELKNQFKTESRKRRQIKFNSRKNSNPALTLQNKKYLNYLLENSILTTNAVVNEPTFQGKTNVFISPYKVTKGDKKIGQEAPNITSNQPKSEIGGSINTLQTNFPKLPKNAKLSTDGSVYIINGKEHKRVSTLKKDFEGPMNESSIAGAIRGDVIDSMFRDAFSPDIATRNRTQEEFKAIVKKRVEDLQKDRKGFEGNVVFEDATINQLYTTIKQYQNLFEKKGWIVYSQGITVNGKVGNVDYAGTIDLLVFDKNTRKWIIIDVKTTSTSRVDSYKEGAKFNNQKNDAIQLTAYKQFFEELTGIKNVEIAILPILTTTEKVINNNGKENYHITTAISEKVITEDGEIYENFLRGNDFNKKLEELVDKSKLKPVEKTKKAEKTKEINEEEFFYPSNEDVTTTEAIPTGDLTSISEEEFYGLEPYSIEQEGNTSTQKVVKTKKVAPPSEVSKKIEEKVENKSEKTLKSENKSVSLQNEPKKLNMDKLSKEVALELLMDLDQMIEVNFNSIMSDNLDIFKEEIKRVYESSNITEQLKETIENKCKIG